MNRVFLCVLFSFFFSLIFAMEDPFREQAKVFLENRIIEHQDQRFDSFLLALKLLSELDAKVIVETGTARRGKNFRGDGGATIIFGDWASQNAATVYSVDIDPTAVANALDVTQEYRDHVKISCNNSLHFLAEFPQPIDFLYLDSFDFDSNNPSPSQNHHLNELLIAYSKLHSKSIVMIDDCTLPGGGKGKLVIEFLLSKGWEILFSGYQVILAPAGLKK